MTQTDDTRIIVKLTTMASSAVHNLRAAGHADDLDIEVCERLDCAERTYVTTMRIRAKVIEAE
jgi:hypothetical protein